MTHPGEKAAEVELPAPGETRRMTGHGPGGRKARKPTAERREVPAAAERVHLLQRRIRVHLVSAAVCSGSGGRVPWRQGRVSSQAAELPGLLRARMIRCMVRERWGCGGVKRWGRRGIAMDADDCELVIVGIFLRGQMRLCVGSRGRRKGVKHMTLWSNTSVSEREEHREQLNMNWKILLGCWFSHPY